MILNDFSLLYYLKLYVVLSSFRLCYVQFKEVKILLEPEAEGRITQTPFYNTCLIIIYNMCSVILFALN